jgi:hypothetical protein
MKNEKFCSQLSTYVKRHMKETLDFSFWQEEIAADVIKDSAMEEESDNELDELQNLQLRRNFLTSQEMAMMQ